MIRKQKRNKKDGTKRTYISVLESYRPGKGMMSKHRVVKNFGCLEEQENPETFLEEIKKFDKEYFDNKKDINVILPQIGKLDSQKTYNYGYVFLDSIYQFLELDQFFKKIDTKASYNLNKIFKFLVLNRIMNPDSKSATQKLVDNFYNFKCNFQLHQVYRALDLIYENMNDMQVYLNEIIKKKIGRENALAYYDVTNYYSEIDFPLSEEDLRQKGVSKEHRVDPIIQLGLFMDNNNLPISMSLFKGNVSDSLTLQPSMKKIKDDFDLRRLIVVADKGMNSNKNLSVIIKNQDGYVVSQILRGKKGKRYFDRFNDDSKFTYNQDRTYKYQLFEEDYPLKQADGSIINHTRKVLIYWKKSIADREMKKRELKINQALKSMTNNAYGLTHDATKYLNVNHYVEDTGEIAEKVAYSLNYEKIKEDSVYDGYFCIATSEQNFTKEDIHNTYSGLGKIEESFRITKSNLEARPIYLSTNNHIQAHFQICFVSLLILRLLELKFPKDAKLSIEQIVETLNKCQLEILRGGIIHFTLSEPNASFISNSLKLDSENESETSKNIRYIQKLFNSEHNFLNTKQEVFNRYIKNILFNTTK